MRGPQLQYMQPVTLELELKSRNVPPALESENGPAENPQEIIIIVYRIEDRENRHFCGMPT